MTSTPFNIGLTTETRASSRVLKPPGGGHTDIFGIHDQGPEPLRTGRRAAPNKGADQIKLSGENEPEVKESNGDHQACENNSDSNSENNSEIGNDVPNPEVEEKREEIKGEPQAAEAPKRVRVPPGGFSSGFW